MVKFSALVDITKIYKMTSMSLDAIQSECKYIDTQINQLINGGGTPLRVSTLHRALLKDSDDYNALVSVFCMEINDLLNITHPGDWLSCEIKFINNNDKPHVEITLGFDSSC